VPPVSARRAVPCRSPLPAVDRGGRRCLGRPKSWDFGPVVWARQDSNAPANRGFLRPGVARGMHRTGALDASSRPCSAPPRSPRSRALPGAGRDVRGGQAQHPEVLLGGVASLGAQHRPRSSRNFSLPTCADVTAKGSTARRGYGAAHARLRKSWARRIEAGEAVPCARCGLPITAGMHWDLGHVDGSRTEHSGPEHRRCNRATASRQPRRRRATRKPPYPRTRSENYSTADLSRAAIAHGVLAGRCRGAIMEACATFRPAR
jgi:hypothetical protein